MAVTHLCFNTAVQNLSTSSFIFQEARYFGVPRRDASVPPLQEVVTFRVFVFSTVPYKVEEGVGREAPESKTQESLRGP